MPGDEEQLGIALGASTGDERADEALPCFIAACEHAFPERVRAQVLASLTGQDALARKLCLQCVQRIAYPDPQMQAAQRAAEQATKDAGTDDQGDDD